jgi:hypothetical protein
MQIVDNDAMLSGGLDAKAGYSWHLKALQPGSRTEPSSQPSPVLAA